MAQFLPKETLGRNDIGMKGHLVERTCTLLMDGIGEKKDYSPGNIVKFCFYNGHQFLKKETLGRNDIEVQGHLVEKIF